jgi:hypothetical protein
MRMTQPYETKKSIHLIRSYGTWVLSPDHAWCGRLTRDLNDQVNKTTCRKCLITVTALGVAASLQLRAVDKKK